MCRIALSCHLFIYLFFRTPFAELEFFNLNENGIARFPTLLLERTCAWATLSINWHTTCVQVSSVKHLTDVNYVSTDATLVKTLVQMQVKCQNDLIKPYLRTLSHLIPFFMPDIQHCKFFMDPFYIWYKCK